jgi:hypothetical protein
MPRWLQDLVQRVALVVVVHAVKMLLDGGGRGVGARHLDRHRVLQVAVGQPLDFGRKGGREQQCGALLGQKAQDALQIRQKADVQHAVGLVQHHVLDLIQYGVLGFDVVQQAPGGGHQDFHAFFQLECLRLHVHAAEHHGAAQLVYLAYSLTCSATWSASSRVGSSTKARTGWRAGEVEAVLVFQHAVQQRQGKGGGLAGTRLGGAHHIAAGASPREWLAPGSGSWTRSPFRPPPGPMGLPVATGQRPSGPCLRLIHWKHQ